MQKLKLKFKIQNLYKLIIISILFVLFDFINTQAAELYLKSSQDRYFPNEIFKAEIRLNVSPGENVTALEAKIKYNFQDLTAVEFLTANSILTFVDQANIDVNNGIISFSGIIPGGYTGRLPGDPGESNLLGTIALQVLKTNNPETKIEVSNASRILLDDGQELKTNLVFQSLDININPQEVVFNPLNELESSKELDKIPPEEFTPEIIQINNEYFVAFNTQDKQSGVDHYSLNILERNFWGRSKIIKQVENITSPYPVSQEEIKKPMQIIAFDKAGNERKATLRPLAELKWYQNYLVWGIIIIILVILGFILRRFKKHNG
jgi:uncharacterized integral membrane protein